MTILDNCHCVCMTSGYGSLIFIQFLMNIQWKYKNEELKIIFYLYSKSSFIQDYIRKIGNTFSFYWDWRPIIIGPEPVVTCFILHITYIVTLRVSRTVHTARKLYHCYGFEVSNSIISVPKKILWWIKIKISKTLPDGYILGSIISVLWKLVSIHCHDTSAQNNDKIFCF